MKRYLVVVTYAPRVMVVTAEHPEDIFNEYVDITAASFRMGLPEAAVDSVTAIDTPRIDAHVPPPLEDD